MHTIRYTKRICTDEAIIEAFLNETRVGIVAMIDEQNMPYATPVNYVWYKGAVYFHGWEAVKKRAFCFKNLPSALPSSMNTAPSSILFPVMPILRIAV